MDEMKPTYDISSEMIERLENNFTHHPPKNESQIARYEQIRAWCKELAVRVCAHTPPSREQSVALTHLENVMMWANAAIARNE